MKNKVTIIGAGTVGATVAYTLVAKSLASEILLIDIKTDKADGEAMDIYQSTPYLSPAIVRSGNYEDAVGSDIVIITSGLPRKDGMTRLDLAQVNVNIIRSIAAQISKYAPEAKYVIISNPVDVLTYEFIKASGIPASRVMGSGTLLDTARLSACLAQTFNVEPSLVDAVVFGEHGDSSFVPWSMASVCGEKIESYAKNNAADLDKDGVESYVHKSGGQIIKNKGVTNFGIAAVSAELVKNLSSETDTVCPVSVLLNGEYGISDVCVSIMAVLNSSGVVKTIVSPMTEEEKAKLVHSAQAIKSVIDQVE
jgi:L-lactate dehydrogenase